MAMSMESAYLEAYDKYSEELFKRCCLSLRDRELARDVVQETYARAWEYLRKGNRIEYFRAFLYRVANNLIVDTVRKSRTSSLDALVEEKNFELKDEDATDPTTRIEVREAVRHLKTIGGKYQAVVKLRYMNDMAPRTIADVLGVSENVVSVRLHRALRQLSKMMEVAPR